MQVLLSVRVGIKFRTPVQRRPLWLVLEQSHSLDILLRSANALGCPSEITYVLFISCEPMIYARRQYDPVEFVEADSNPLISYRPNIEKAIALKDVSDLLVLMQVLIEEHFHLIFVHTTHGLRRDSNNITILIVALCRQLVDSLNFWVAKIENA